MERFLKGIIVGIGGVAPGLSGSVLLIIFGLYQKTLEALGTLLKDFLLVHPEIVLMRSTEENAHFKARFIPIENKRGIFALCSDPSESFAGTDLWQLLSYCLKPTLQ